MEQKLKEWNEKANGAAINQIQSNSIIQSNVFDWIDVFDGWVELRSAHHFSLRNGVSGSNKLIHSQIKLCSFINFSSPSCCSQRTAQINQINEMNLIGFAAFRGFSWLCLHWISWLIVWLRSLSFAEHCGVPPPLTHKRKRSPINHFIQITAAAALAPFN